MESVRLSTFKDKWPDNCKISPDDLARCGFFYVGPGTTVRCFQCRLTTTAYAGGDNPDQFHLILRQSCAFDIRRKKSQYACENIPLNPFFYSNKASSDDYTHKAKRIKLG